MTDQPTLFPTDPPRRPSETQKKVRGKAVAAAKNGAVLEAFQAIAHILGREQMGVTIEHVRYEAERRGIAFTPGNWMGSVFPASEWVSIGTATTTHKGGHGRLVRVWRRR